MIGWRSDGTLREGLLPQAEPSNRLGQPLLVFIPSKNKEKGGVGSAFLPFPVNQNLGDPTQLSARLAKESVSKTGDFA